MIVAENLAKTFPTPKGPVHALSGVSFTAHQGAITALLGVNGAGKTTALRILSTLLRADSGTATVDGLDVQKQSDQVRARIGFLSSSTALYGRLNGREVLQYFGTLYGLKGAHLKSRIEYVTETLRLHEFLDRLCDKLSTGQKQRMSIARAILHDPPVLFFDEPTAGLDVVTSQTILEFIESCRTEGKTVVFSTHIMSEVERLCDQVYVIHEGVIKASGTVAEVNQLASAANLERAFLNLVGYQTEIEVARA